MPQSDAAAVQEPSAPEVSSPSTGAAGYVPGATYKVDEPTRGEMSGPLGERFEYSFKAGTVKPRSEQEEAALEQLWRLGRAERNGERLPRPGEEAPA